MSAQVPSMPKASLKNEMRAAGSRLVLGFCKVAPGALRMGNLRRVLATTVSLLLVPFGAVSAGGFDDQQSSAAEIVQPVAKSYQELQHALAGPMPNTPLTPDQIAARLDKLFSMLEEAEKQIPRDKRLAARLYEWSALKRSCLMIRN